MTMTTDDPFDCDPYPGRPRILFIGWPESSHTHSWIDLLRDAPFNVRLFCLPSAEPPADWPVKCYLTSPASAPQAAGTRRSAFPPRRGSPSYYAYLQKQAVAHGILSSGPVGRGAAGVIERLYGARQPTTIERALADTVRRWRPDVIHTLGIDPASYLYNRARDAHGLEGIGRWIVQARGGPDLALHRHVPHHSELITAIFASCDHFVADNALNYGLAEEMGLAPHKARDPGMGVVSGAGGIDIEALASLAGPKPSTRERIIVWPKAYETMTSKALPVFEAILKYWAQLQPCRIEMLWLVQPEVQIWYDKLFPPEIKAHCPIFGRLSRSETLARIGKARVMMAPSLSDGIPNTMMEAMALGAAPLVSPLDTIVPVVRAEENVLFARNLYPDEIGEALVRFMNDDALVDRMAENNRIRIQEMADRTRVKAAANSYYEEIFALASELR